MAKQYKTHAEVENKYKWDLSFLLEGKTPEERIKEVMDLLKKQVEIKDSKYESPEKYLESLKLGEQMTLKMNKLSNYLSNSISLNVVDPTISKLMQQFKFEAYQISIQLGAEAARFFAHADKIAEWAKRPEFADFKYSIENTLEEKDHQLSKEIEEFRTRQKRADGNFAEIFSIITNAELKFADAIDSKGKKHKVSQVLINDLKKSDDKKLRVSAQESYKAAMVAHKQSLSNVLFQHKKAEATYSVIKKFPSTIESLIFGDRVPKTLLTTLFSEVQSAVPVYKQYDAAWKKFYKAKYGEAPTKYDRGREISKLVPKKITVEEGIDVFLKAIEPMGEEYVSVVKHGLENNWVDFMPVQNKRGGAYSIGGAHGLEKILILMNWDDTDRSVETLAHEFGHSMHSYFSTKNNSVSNSSYKIFVAEIASIFNELMLLDYQLKNSKDDNFKFATLDRTINGFIGTVFRQVEWANYEFDFYEALDKGAPLNTFEAISKMYYENSKKYTVKSNLDYKNPDDFYAAVVVPHFYYGFYVYKYAIGQLVANIFFAKYKNEGQTAIDAYIKNFLSAGGSKNPIDILKDAGVDLLDPKVYELGFQAFAKNVKEWISLGNKIYKTKK